MQDALCAGRLLARRYRLIDQVGAGGMSIVWRARDEVLDRVVALKVLAPELAADQRFRDLVREEARSAAQLVHPHVTAVHDYGEMIAPDGTVTAFVVMELLTGESLERRLSAGPLPWPEALKICAQVAEALAAAHRIGIVHRDVTPGNVMLTPAGVKVLDFGIAARVGAPDEDEGDAFGTPAYVAPERLDGTPALPATDAYGLGVLLYETLTGRVPFPALTWEELARYPRREVPPALTGVAGLPPAVADLCRRCLACAPLDRPAAREVAEQLSAHLPGSDAGSAPPRVITLPVVTGATGLAGAPAPTLPGLPGHPLPGPPGHPLPGPPGHPLPHLPGQPVPHLLGQPVLDVPTRPVPISPAFRVPARQPVGGSGGTRPRVAATRAAPRPGPQAPRSAPARWGRAVTAIATAVLLASAGVLAVTLYQPKRATRTGPPAPAAQAPASPTPGPAAASGAPKPPAGADPSTATSATPGHGSGPAPTGAPAPTVDATIATINQIINQGLAAGQIRPDAGTDLRQLVGHLRELAGRGQADLAGEAQHLREKVAARKREGAIGAGAAGTLDEQLQRLAMARY